MCNAIKVRPNYLNIADYKEANMQRKHEAHNDVKINLKSWLFTVRLQSQVGGMFCCHCTLQAFLFFNKRWTFSEIRACLEVSPSLEDVSPYRSLYSFSLRFSSMFSFSSSVMVNLKTRKKKHVDFVKNI